MESESFRQTKKDMENKMPEIPPTSLPPQLQHALRKNAERMQKEEEVPSSGPRLAFTGNTKLDELIAGIKEQVYKYEKVELPSRGKFYDGIVAPEDGIIHVRCMTGEEEQILATQRFIKKGLAINMIFKNCVRESIVPEKLINVDRTWLLIYLRGISYGPDYDVEVRCTECNQKFQETIDIDTLIVNKCPDDFSPDSLNDTLPKSKYKFTYRLPTAKDENLIQEHRDQRIRKNMDGSDDTWTYRASLLIEDIEGLTDKSAIQALVSRLSIQDVAYIRTVLTDPPFGIDTKLAVLCKYCTEEFQVEMPMDTSFFFPKAKRMKSTQA